MPPFDTSAIRAPARATDRPLIDPIGRAVTYLRVSVTDRCDLRCAYCMPQQTTFLPRADLLTLEEMYALISAFIRRGVRKVRLTGGEPLLRRNIEKLIEWVGRDLRNGAIDELTVTTNATHLAEHAKALAESGVKRINVSLDTLDPDLFQRIARSRALDKVLAGIDATLAAGIRIKINMVALKDLNAAELPRMIAWAHQRGMDISLIEVMPMGDVEEDRFDQYLPLTEVRARLEKIWMLTDIDHCTGGPSRYVRIEETGGRLGFISPLTQNFCDGCNRVRLTCTGRLYMCLGQDDAADFRDLLRAGARDEEIDAALDAAIARKPRGHDFRIDEPCAAPAVARRMSTTGG